MQRIGTPRFAASETVVFTGAFSTSPWVIRVKYLGDKPRGFTVLSMPSKNGRMDAGECTSPRPSHDGSAGIHTRTPGASVRVGGSTPPDNTRHTTPKARVLRGVAFPRNCAQLLRIKVFNPRHNCVPQYGGMGHIAYAIHPRGQAPRHSRCITVEPNRSIVLDIPSGSCTLLVPVDV